MIFPKRIFLVLLLFCSGILHSQWTNISNTVPARVDFLAKSGSGKIFAGTGAGIYFSVDSGNTWNPVIVDSSFTFSTNCITVRDTLVMVGTGYGIYRSRDDGKTWEHLYVGSNYYSHINCIIFKDNLVFAGTDSYLYKSSNDGNNWSTVPFGCFIIGANSLAYNSSYLFAVTQVGSSHTVYRSSNNGAFWELANNGISTSFGVYGIRSCGERIYGILSSGYCYTDDNGSNWVEISGCGSPHYNSIGNSDGQVFMTGSHILTLVMNCLYMVNFDVPHFINDCIISSSYILIATDSGFYKTTDLCQTWNASNEGYIYYKYYNAGAIASLVYAGAYFAGVIYKYDGYNWYPTYYGQMNGKPHFFQNAFPYVFAYEEDKILKTDCYQSSWSEINFMSTKPKSFALCNYYMAASNSSHSFFKSTNNGVNWTPLTSTGLSGEITKVIKTVITPDLYLLACVKTINNGYKLFRLPNQGSMWQEIGFPIQTGQYFSMMKNLYGAIWAYSPGSGVYISTNNGSNWILRNNGLPADSVSDFSGENGISCCATSSNGVFRTTNEGMTWQSYNQNLGNLRVNGMSCYFGVLYAATDSGLYKTDITVDVRGENALIKEYNLFQNYPNPFNPKTRIKYCIPRGNLVSIVVYDVTGKEILTLTDKYKNAGTHEVEFDGNNFSCGVYIYRLVSGDYTSVKKMILIK